MPPSAADVTRLVQAAVVPAVFTCGLSMLFLYIASSADPMNRFAIPTVSGDSVTAQLKRLATFSDDPNPAVTRILFTDADMNARRYVRGLMTDAGLRVRSDGMGNIFGRWEGTHPAERASHAGRSERSLPPLTLMLGCFAAAPVVTGSHCDAIPLSGMYDGTLGVIGAIAAVRALNETGFVPLRPIDVMMFTSEEPTRFGLGCIGSRAMAGALTAKALDATRDENSTSFRQAAQAIGYESTSSQDVLDRTRVKKAGIHAFVELHIEQGPVLEKAREELGLVTAIAAPAALRVTFTGDGGHAGGQLMAVRNDAGLAAAELSLHVETATLATGSEDAVGTTGRLELSPNAVNSVPRGATLEIDVRDIDGERRDATVASIVKEAAAIAKRRKVKHTVSVINQDPPATCSDEVIAAAEISARQLGTKYRKMVSRAYHDSLFMATVAPTSMIFIPCKGGVSHRPDEYASPKDIERGVKALALTLARLSVAGLEEEDAELTKPEL